MRPILYPEVEEYIRNKKRTKLAKAVEEQTRSGDPAKRRAKSFYNV